ncbi:relaxase/mobilization nuclease domain-containing protein [Pedobacter sp. ISL-68]|uniref:relaxase/mobilization nuclease domain-containing protein n=1 Tax=unclassified Pedobacter TaxID=2628915 RepID=UPI001BE896C3|nr:MULTISPECIES: relaxase/mobilization nuclease domain-containing protein [unclassified Pedobacter]MBT2561357.1 relaxase/mobilization nuclease domain-containing protein [Pedobacter sp. ISL-64]MBT2590746.1 relaxase/mobilization nuclease domain-containing protein [Pedobacter sp. ISL-68]
MMGKIPKSGKSFKGCVEYCMLKKDAVILDATGLRTGEVAHTIADFNMQRKMRPGLGQAVGHIALNWSPEDSPKLTDELMVSIAKEYLKKMKIFDTQVLMVRHHDTDHDHLHIVYNRVDNDGKTISDANQRWNNVKASKALTLKYGFHMAAGKDRVNRQRLKGADKAKYQIHDQIKAILPKVKSMEELQKLLAKQGINILYKFKSGTQNVQGISFGKGEYQFKGSEIDRSLSYGKISKMIADRMQEKQEQVQLAKPKSLADELREILKQSGNEPHYLKQGPKEQYLSHEPKTNYLGSLGIDISDDVDDEAIYGRNRRRQEKARTNTR